MSNEEPDNKYTLCVKCKCPFTSKNVHTIEGWRETQISGMCEDCFDALTIEYEEGENDD